MHKPCPKTPMTVGHECKGGTGPPAVGALNKLHGPHGRSHKRPKSRIYRAKREISLVEATLDVSTYGRSSGVEVKPAHMDLNMNAMLLRCMISMVSCPPWCVSILGNPCNRQQSLTQDSTPRSGKRVEAGPGCLGPSDGIAS